MKALIQALGSVFTAATFFVAAGLAKHGHISWWFLVLIAAWGLAMGTMAFSAGWDARSDRKRR